MLLQLMPENKTNSNYISLKSLDQISANGASGFAWWCEKVMVLTRISIMMANHCCWVEGSSRDSKILPEWIRAVDRLTSDSPGQSTISLTPAMSCRHLLQRSSQCTRSCRVPLCSGSTPRTADTHFVHCFCSLQTPTGVAQGLAYFEFQTSKIINWDLIGSSWSSQVEPQGQREYTGQPSQSFSSVRQ